MNSLSDEEKKIPKQAQHDPEKAQTPHEASAFRNAWEMQAQARREAELRERKRQADAEEAAYREREEYARELQEEKVELMRLRQGVIEESDKLRGRDPEKKYSLGERFGNWLYHSKWWLGIAVFVAFVGAFLIYDYVTREDPDLRILVISANDEIYLHTPELTGWAAEHCPDYNGNEKQEVGLVYVPVSQGTLETGSADAASSNTQLMVQFETATCMLVIADDASEAYLTPEGKGAEIFADLETLYPDCAAVDGYKLMLSGTQFAKRLGLEKPLNAGTYLAIRQPYENMETKEKNQIAFDQAKELLDQLMPELMQEGAE